MTDLLVPAIGGSRTRKERTARLEIRPAAVAADAGGTDMADGVLRPREASLQLPVPFRRGLASMTGTCPDRKTFPWIPLQSQAASISP